MRMFLYLIVVVGSFKTFAVDLRNVSTGSGPVVGVELSTTVAFKGIPYAAAPVGPLRWMPPQPAAKWSQPLYANAFGSKCPQMSTDIYFPTVIGDEDCLFLNVWRPLAKNEAPLPVMVFLHGGANTIGAANESLLGALIYDGSKLSARGPCIVVTLNYRLGALGFMAHPDLAKESVYRNSGNYGVLDQIQALHWVQENISAFGGDPSNVTIFGESAGAVDAMALMVSPLSNGLFAKVILQSGFLSEVPLKNAEERGQEIAKTVGCADQTNLVECLHKLRARDLVGIGDKPGKLSAFNPTIDGQVLTSGMLAAFQRGTNHKVKVMIGTNADEMSTLAPAMADSAKIVTQSDYETRIKSDFGVNAAAVLQRYPVGNSTPRKTYEALLGDAFAHCPNRQVARALASHGLPVYKYVFAHANDNPYLNGLGAGHGMELFYVFGTLVGTPAEFAMSDLMINYWTSFAATGDPNSKGQFTWPKYAGEEYLQIDTQPSTAHGFRDEQCDFWDSLANPS